MEYTKYTPEQAEKIIANTYDNDFKLYLRAFNLQKDLGLGGLWKYSTEVLARIIEELKGK